MYRALCGIDNTEQIDVQGSQIWRLQLSRDGVDFVFEHTTDLVHASIRQDNIDGAEFQIPGLEQFENIVPARNVAFTKQHTTTKMSAYSVELQKVTYSPSSEARFLPSSSRTSPMIRLAPCSVLPL